VECESRVRKREEKKKEIGEGQKNENERGLEKVNCDLSIPSQEKC
jgi:hypothetical protein